MNENKMNLVTKDLVPSRCWYYLLEFNDKDNWKTISEGFDTMKLSQLTVEQFWLLFQVATEADIKNK